jgi:hypothetical protein
VEDAALVHEILEHGSFRSMRKSQSRWSSRRPADMPQFVRKGTVGDWTNYFSPSQAARMLNRFESKTRSTRCARLWPEILEIARKRAAADESSSLA